ncbi:hypothetical protein LIER_29390 [Lithospermum erythrorhizon]|uniref:DUF4283 domain-containing protein n=1 Tax=Lithospermum erythrorhizon TaxID=34254 RepID=A0AAV3RM18_LITER
MDGELSRVLGSLSLEAEEMDEVFVPVLEYERVEEKFQYSLIGKLLTTRKFSVRLFKNSLNALWRRQYQLQIIDMGGNLFHFIFNDGDQMIRVLLGEPWLFEGHTILLREWEAEKPLEMIQLTTLPFWVQIWNLPPAYIGAEFGRAIGAHIGEVLTVDKRSIEQQRGRFVRVKVRLNVDKPLNTWGERAQFRRREEKKEQEFRQGNEDGGPSSEYGRRTSNWGINSREREKELSGIGYE